MGYSGFIVAEDLSWQDNNYAEFYAKQNSKHVVIMASAGAGNSLWQVFSYAFPKL